MAPHLPAPGRVVPLSTYRLQLHPGFTFDDAAAVVDVLAALGVSHVYCSPLLQAAPGSTHGYDVVDHSRLSEELGGSEGWGRLVDAARAAGLGLVADVVPNHVAVPAPESLNPALWDVLARGPQSAYARWFDVDWTAQDGRLLMPVLGSPIGECLRRGEITLAEGEPAPVVRYFDHVLPVAAGTEHLPLPELLEAQHWRLAFWRVGTEELNYRRFFDITSLAGVRVEDPAVFNATHARLLRLVQAGDLDGLRIDHPDGLADPGGYLARLAEATGGAWVVAEKILEGDERLPGDWACAGTTGYDALNQVMGVLTDPAGAPVLSELYASLTGMPVDVEQVVERAKRLAVTEVLRAEVSRLLDLLARIARESLDTRDTTRRWLREALVELLVAFPVYRAYVDPGRGAPPGCTAAAQIDRAVTAATRRRPERAAEIAWIGRLAAGHGSGSPAARELVVRFGQTAGPAMAKGVEDTAFYRHARLIALNEVGGDPGTMGRDPADLHAWCARVARDWPATMTTLSTHDTKRSEDVRARLLVLAERPEAWGRAVTEWRAAASAHRGPQGPGANLEYVFWQSLVGAWPIDEQRMQRYVEKAAREAKLATSWVDPVPAYDDAVRAFVSGVFADRELLGRVERFVAEVTPPGRVNALSQKLLQLTLPGVPDTYQGCELWDLALVDPDNRRPVDFARRRELLAALPEPGELPDLPDLAADDEGLAKLLVTSRALRLRRMRPAALGPGASYEPLEAAGEAADHLVGFVRGGQVATVVTRLPVGLAARGGWGETAVTLPAGRWRDALSGAEHAGGPVRLADLLAVLPVALLERV